MGRLESDPFMNPQPVSIRCRSCLREKPVQAFGNFRDSLHRSCRACLKSIRNRSYHRRKGQPKRERLADSHPLRHDNAIALRTILGRLLFDHVAGFAYALVDPSTSEVTSTFRIWRETYLDQSQSTPVTLLQIETARGRLILDLDMGMNRIVRTLSAGLELRLSTDPMAQPNDRPDKFNECFLPSLKDPKARIEVPRIKHDFIEGMGSLASLAKRFVVSESTLRFLAAAGSWQLEKDRRLTAKLDSAKRLRVPTSSISAPLAPFEAVGAEITALVRTFTLQDLERGRSLPLYDEDGRETGSISFKIQELAVSLRNGTEELQCDFYDTRTGPARLAALIAARKLSITSTRSKENVT